MSKRKPVPPSEVWTVAYVVPSGRADVMRFVSEAEARDEYQRRVNVHFFRREIVVVLEKTVTVATNAKAVKNV